MGRNIRITVEAELRAPGILVQVGEYEWNSPTEMAEQYHVPSVTLLLSPPHSFAEASSLERTSNRFVDVGDLVFAPVGVHAQFRASGGPIRLARCSFEPSHFNEASGFNWPWQNETPQACANIKNTRLRWSILSTSTARRATFRC